MDLEKIVDMLSYTIPSITTGLVAYYFFVNYTKAEEQKFKLSLLRENQKQSLPLKLQAYERMVLFLERINPSNLVVRIPSVNNDKNAYATSVISAIEQEFEHNLTQQIYISNKCWSVIVTAKNATIQLIKKTALQESVLNAQDLREAILKATLSNTAPSATALGFIKEEVRDFM
ncbi:hypothetical protein EC396_10170 [Lutibacter sp. HS1-25]|uniref:DUF7935 family protein n=1 Tax=Lutibacter sp. HS1-25 TaxID=2485000 RepID=UPI0010118D41|nr:hypothetical protein [Lutibacter sp. HS1-25]RXP53455.1 hypothetical protein EC396_10170 [Lutibacter sp. HS1-25]